MATIYTDRVYVLVIEHRHGLDVSAFVNEDHAHQALEEYCKEWWEREISEPMPENKDEMVDLYFEKVEEGWVIRECELLVPPANSP